MSSFRVKTHLPGLVLWLVAALLLSACAPLAATQSIGERDYGGAPAPAPAKALDLAPAAPVQEAAVSGSNAPAEPQPGTERIIIKNGSLTVVVLDPVKSVETISRMAEEMGGFVVTANIYKEYVANGSEVPRASLTIRVPAGRMNEAMARIKAESSQDPQNENISSQDVTSEYVDLQSRLKNLEAAEAELTRIMQSAKKTEDVLAVYSQLVSIREQIEVTKGQIKYYAESAALSAISVELIADAAVQPIAIGGWQPTGIAKDAVEALIQTLQFLVNALIWIVIYFLPVLLILFAIFVLPPILLIRAWNRRRRQKKAAAASPPPTATPEA